MSRYSDYVLSLGPKLYWRLGEPSGTTANDASGNSNTGTYGAGCTLAQAGFLAGDPETSVLFGNSSTSTVKAGAYVPFVVNSPRTFVGWAYRSATTDIDYIFGGSLSGASGAPYLRCSAGSETIVFSPNAAGAGTASWTNAWPGTSQWVHWALTYDDSTGVAELFMNGVSQGQQTVSSGTRYSGAANDFFQAAALGSGASTTAWGGYMQEVAVFESILTAAQIKAAYQAAFQPAAGRLRVGSSLRIAI